FAFFNTLLGGLATAIILTYNGSMTVELLTLSDFAQDAFGKLIVVGVFDAIMVKEFPAVHPFMAIAARIRFPVYELGEHQARVEIKDSSGRQLVPPLDGRLNINNIGTDSACANLTLNLMNLRFEQEMTWHISLQIDGQEKAGIPLFIRKVSAQNRPPQLQ
ncbi:MAG TPA: hypothetical protein DCY05_10840, partial [Spirochaetaceae bacterium]|nr:hypothetical protein [Spirochaetaceae bacterium]